MAAINDATLQKVGDLYQYFIALLDCFSLKKGEAMLIETQGDVSNFFLREKSPTKGNKASLRLQIS